MLWPFRLLVWCIIARVAADSTFTFPWSTDATCKQQNCGAFGPDGPWQALIVDINQGNGSVSLPLYPSVFYGSSILTSAAGGVYNPAKSASANQTVDDQVDLHDGDIDFDPFVSQDVEVAPYIDLIRIGKGQVNLNTTVYAARKWTVRLSNGSNYTPNVGFLGLGSPDTTSGSSDAESILDQIVDQKSASASSFSLHIGSAKLNQSGSLIAGGYDQARVIDPVGSWTEYESIGLRDVTLGVEQGGSPFPNLGITQGKAVSLWPDINNQTMFKNNSRPAWAAKRLVRVGIIPEVPSIYLPADFCKAIAKHLPVTWRTDIGYYVWNTSDVQYDRVVSSPAYLGFLLEEASPNNNITIKIPFGLLNLTLEPPIVDKPTPYFPCRGIDAPEGVWVLGRAFLQGAFFAKIYESNKVYLAQAPGPDLGPPVVKTLGPLDQIVPSPADSFARTWESTWTPLPTAKRGLSPGSIAGSVIGAIAGVTVVTVAAFYCLKRRNKKRNEEGEKLSTDGVDEIHEVVGSGHLPHEMVVPSISHEIQAQSQPQELPGDIPNDGHLESEGLMRPPTESRFADWGPGQR